MRTGQFATSWILEEYSAERLRGSPIEMALLLKTT